MKLFHFLFLIGVGIFTLYQSLLPAKSLPVYAFQNGVNFKTVKERVKVLEELGYDGIGSAKLSKSDLSLPDRLKAYEKAGLKIFSFYIGGKLLRKVTPSNPRFLKPSDNSKGMTPSWNFTFRE